MGVGVVVRGDIQLRCSAGHHAGGRLRAVALQVFIGDVQRGGGDCQVVVAVAAAVCAAGGWHIYDQHVIA